jgi:hypothetical protein
LLLRMTAKEKTNADSSTAVFRLREKTFAQDDIRFLLRLQFPR